MKGCVNSVYRKSVCGWGHGLPPDLISLRPYRGYVGQYHMKFACSKTSFTGRTVKFLADDGRTANQIWSCAVDLGTFSTWPSLWRQEDEASCCLPPWGHILWGQGVQIDTFLWGGVISPPSFASLRAKNRRCVIRTKDDSLDDCGRHHSHHQIHQIFKTWLDLSL